jgi:hypothetical protein
MSRVVIAGAGVLGQALARRLAPAHQVRGIVSSEPLPAVGEGLTWRRADLTSIPDAEVALAGAETVVLLAQARRPPARHTRAALDDLDRLLADAVARATKRVGAKRLVTFACGDSDARLPLLQHAGVPVTVLHGGGPDPVAHLAALVDGAPVPPAAAWAGEPPARGPREGLATCSVQRYARPAGWSALDVAKAYFEWLPTDVLGVRTEVRGGVFRVHGLGVEGLVLRLVEGRSEADSAWLEVADGKLAVRSAQPGRLEFRVLLDGSAVLAALIGYVPAMPWPLYRASQAPLHERVMRRFGAWLEQQSGAPAAA